MTTTASDPVRTGQNSANGKRVGRKALRAPRGPRGEQARRRVFGPDYKLAVLAAYDRCSEPGEKGALLRREGLYTSHLAEWRKARDAGARKALGPKANARRSPEQVEVEKLRRRNERLEAELARTRLALEITGKAHALLELLSESADSDPKSKP